MAESGLKFSYVMMIFEDIDGSTPKASLAKNYHSSINSPSYPVLADVNEQSLSFTPYDGKALPGKCALAPDMTLLGCKTGHEDGGLTDLIKQHAAEN